MVVKRKLIMWDKEMVSALREYLGVTQSKMAEKLGTRQQTISEWELGNYQPRGMSVTLLNIIADHSRFKYEANGNNTGKSKR